MQRTHLKNCVCAVVVRGGPLQQQLGEGEHHPHVRKRVRGGEGGLIGERDRAQLVRRAEGRRLGMLLLQGRREHHQVWAMAACEGFQAQATVEVRH